MVRINRTYSIEEDLVNKLKDEVNVSELINSLLVHHFNKSNSKDLRVLKNKIDEIENELDNLRRKRDRIADDIREIEAQAEEVQKAREIYKERENSIKEKIKFLSDKVKSNEITFEEYQQIKALENWEGYIKSVIDGDIEFDKVLGLLPSSSD